MNWQLALVTMTIVPPLAIATVWFRRASARAYEDAREKIGTVNADFQESLSGVRVAQAYVSEEPQQPSGSPGCPSDYLEARLRAQQLVAHLLPVRRDAVGDRRRHRAGGRRVASWPTASLSPGELDRVPALPRPVLLADPAAVAGVRHLPAGAVALDRIGELLSTPTLTPERRRDPVQPGRLRGEIRFEDVHFAYPTDGRRGAPRRRPRRSRPGETVAIVGETGAGKSTLEKLVARYYDVTGGRVTVDGVDVRDYDLAALRHQLGVVPQEPFLFAGTIRDNIAYGRDDATDAEVEAAARAVGAHDVVARQSGRLPARGRRAGPVAVVGPAPAARPGPGPARRPGDPAARRGHVEPRPGHRGPGQRGHGRRGRGPHHAS